MDDEFWADDTAPESHPIRRVAAALVGLVLVCSLFVWQVWPGASLLFTRSLFQGWLAPSGLTGSPREAIPRLVDALQRGDAEPIQQALGRSLTPGEFQRIRATVVPYPKAGLASVSVGTPGTAAGGSVRYPVSVWSLNLYSVTPSVFVFAQVKGRWFLRGIEPDVAAGGGVRSADGGRSAGSVG